MPLALFYLLSSSPPVSHIPAESMREEKKVFPARGSSDKDNDKRSGRPERGTVKIRIALPVDFCPRLQSHLFELERHYFSF